jgi:hypothetical protein
MDNDWPTALLIGVTIGAVIGIFVARQSLKEQAIRGGLLAQVLHYLACAMLSSTTAFIVTAIVVGVPFLQMFGTAVGIIIVGAVLVLGYGYVEANAPAEDTPLRPTLD